MKRILILSVALALCLPLACGEDGKKPTDPGGSGGEQSNYRDLTERQNVLHNLEIAYNEMNITEYRKIFDNGNFIFFFFDGDVGGSVPVQWGYAEETESAKNMFTRAGGIDNNPILGIDLTLHNFDTATWIEVDPGDDFPGETWYETIIVYTFEIETASGTDFITSGAPSCRFTVREIDGKWKLIRWVDRSGQGVAGLSPTSVKTTTWGKLKARY